MSAMIRGAGSKTLGSVSSARFCRSIVSSARHWNAPVTQPGKPITSQAVKADITAVPGHVKTSGKDVKADVKAKVKEQNEQEVPKKAPFSLFGLLLKTALLATVVYGGTLFTATKNDKVMDFVIDKQLPYHEELIDLIEKGEIEDLKKWWKQLSSKLSLPSINKIEELTHKIEKKGEHLIDKTRQELSHAQDPLPSEQLQKLVDVETTVKEKLDKIPSVTLKGGNVNLADEAVITTINSFNALLALLDGSNLGPEKDAMVKDISENISKLSQKLIHLNTSFEEEVDRRLDDTKTQLLTAYTQKELELTQDLVEQYNQERRALDKKHQEMLTKEVDAARKVLSQAAVNATTMVRIEQTRLFEKMVKQKIDEERDGRLKNLDILNQRLDEVEKFSSGLEELVLAIKSKALVQRAASNLTTALTQTPETAPAQNLAPLVEALESASRETGDEVLNIAVSGLSTLLRGESTQSILTAPQLLHAWEQLAPELRSASLLPPNAGLLGHLSSVFFSKLLLPVKGAKPQGRDIESVIARVEQSLVRGELDVAVEEAANLKGWTRKLADDWVREGRKRLEAECLAGLVETEARLL